MAPQPAFATAAFAFSLACSLSLGAAVRAGVTGYQVVTETIGPSTASPKQLEVECPAGKVALGGGVETTLTPSVTAIRFITTRTFE